LPRAAFNASKPLRQDAPRLIPAISCSSISGSLSRLRASCRLEQEIPRNVALLWRLKQRRPAHKTMAHVRRDPLQPLRQVCRAFTRWCKPLDLLSGALVASDGSTCKAVQAKERHGIHRTLQRLLPPSEARSEASLQALARGANEDAQGAPGGARAEQLQAQIAALKQRQRRSQAFQAQLPTRGQEQRARTAPDSRSMQRSTGGGTEGCDNGQTAVDAKQKLSLACAGPNETSDRDWRSPMALQATAVLEGPCEAGADMGDDHGDAVKACLEAGITPSSARPLTSANKKLGPFSTDDFRDDGTTDTSQCPAGERRTFRFATGELERHLRSEATSVCKACALTQACTRSKEGRRVQRAARESSAT
jgi:hypothetical protein